VSCRFLTVALVLVLSSTIGIVNAWQHASYRIFITGTARGFFRCPRRRKPSQARRDSQEQSAQERLEAGSPGEACPERGLTVPELKQRE
jgi:hypothetical protein